MLLKFARSNIIAAGPSQLRALSKLERHAHRHTFAYEPREGMLYVRSRAISSRTNDNFDTFPADELKQAWATFIGKPVFVNHNNDDHTRMRGVIIDAALHEDKSPDGTDDTWVEVLMEVDAKRFPLLAQAVANRDIERTSMGCDVIESECSVCANVARTPDQYCNHVKRMKGQRVRRKNEVTGQIEDVLVHEICRGLSFFENSLLVEDPADPTAFTYGVDTRGLQMAAARSKSKSVELEDHQKDRFEGVTVKKDSNGYFVQTHRARSKSYDTIEKIPDSAIAFIESTGASRMTKKKTAAGDTEDCKECGEDTINHASDCSHADDDPIVNMDGPSIDDEKRSFGSKTAADDAVRVPNQVETLRMHECPVCGADGVWNSDGRCVVCGYLPAPKPFQEPNTDVAGRVDRDGGWFDPDLTEATPFDPPNHQAKKKTPSPVEPALPNTKGQKVALSQGDTSMAQNTKSVATAARQRKAASTMGVNERLVQENAALRERLAAMTKSADVDNPAQPVPDGAAGAPVESTDETIAEPEATSVDVETPGGVIADPISAGGDVESIGGEIEDPILSGTNETTDVEAPVAGTTEVDPAAVIDVEPDNRAETMGEVAFQGDWITPGADTVPNIGGNAAGGSVEARIRTSPEFRAALGRANAQTRDRIWASIRLANLRISAGLAPGTVDAMELARTIEASKDPIEVLVREASTIQTVAASRPVPQSAQRTARRAPSLASQRPAVVGGLASRGEDEALFE